MARELHHRRKDNKYALWSTVVDDYVTKWDDKDRIRARWYADKLEDVITQVDQWMEHVDKEI